MLAAAVTYLLHQQLQGQGTAFAKVLQGRGIAG